MAERLSGADAAQALRAQLRQRVAELTARGVQPRLATLRVGECAADDRYEKSIEKSCAAVGVQLQGVRLSQSAGQPALEAALDRLNRDPAVTGILVLRPLPAGYDEAAICARIDPAKDVDCMSPTALAQVYLRPAPAFAPCTAEACMALLRHYGIEPAGMHAVILGRSQVVGRPLASLLLRQNATVTVCHSQTKELAAICRTADLLIAAMGSPRLVTQEFIKPGAVVLDVGIHWDAQTGKLCGDVDAQAVSGLAGAISPVPGGVGTVTATVLTAHVIAAAEGKKGTL